MKRFLELFRNSDASGGFGLSCLVLLVTFFLCGAAAGSVAAAKTDVGSGLAAYADGLRALGETEGAPASILRAIINAYKYHAAVFILGYTVLGVVGIPLVMAARGFFLSFSVSFLVRILGYGGLLLSAGAFGIVALLTVPCLFILGGQAFMASRTLVGVSAGRGFRMPGALYGREYYIKALICFLVLALSAAVEAFACPSVAGAIIKVILG